MLVLIERGEWFGSDWTGELVLAGRLDPVDERPLCSYDANDVEALSGFIMALFRAGSSVG